MASIVVRNLPESTHRALKARAKKHGRSAEAEVRAILQDAVHPEQRLKIGSELAAFGRQFGGLEIVIDRSETIKPIDFE